MMVPTLRWVTGSVPRSPVRRMAEEDPELDHHRLVEAHLMIEPVAHLLASRASPA